MFERQCLEPFRVQATQAIGCGVASCTPWTALTCYHWQRVTCESVCPVGVPVPQGHEKCERLKCLLACGVICFLQSEVRRILRRRAYGEVLDGAAVDGEYGSQTPWARVGGDID